MAFTGNFMCTSFKQQVLEAVHDFRTSASGGDTFKIALYTNSASFTAATTAYTSTNEVSSANYTAGGGSLVIPSGPTTSGTTGFADFNDFTWSTVTLTARGALIYNSTPTSGSGYTNPTCAVLDFGSDKTATSGDFTVVFPAAADTTAIIRFA